MCMGERLFISFALLLRSLSFGSLTDLLHEVKALFHLRIQLAFYFPVFLPGIMEPACLDPAELISGFQLGSIEFLFMKLKSLSEISIGSGFHSAPRGGVAPSLMFSMAVVQLLLRHLWTPFSTEGIISWLTTSLVETTL